VIDQDLAMEKRAQGQVQESGIDQAQRELC
jgi:hypothetical protein